MSHKLSSWACHHRYSHLQNIFGTYLFFWAFELLGPASTFEHMKAHDELYSCLVLTYGASFGQKSLILTVDKYMSGDMKRNKWKLMIIFIAWFSYNYLM